MEDNIFDKVHEVDMKKTMEEFYIDYAMNIPSLRLHELLYFTERTTFPQPTLHSRKEPATFNPLIERSLGQLILSKRQRKPVHASKVP